MRNKNGGIYECTTEETKKTIEHIWIIYFIHMDDVD